MNAIKQAMINSIPADAQFPKFSGVEKRTPVRPVPHIMIGVKTNGDGSITKGKKITRNVTQITSDVAGMYDIRDDHGEVWKARKVSDFVYLAVS